MKIIKNHLTKRVYILELGAWIGLGKSRLPCGSNIYWIGWLTLVTGPL